MSIRSYTLNQAEEWDSIVRSFSDYDVYWFSGYVKAFRIHGDGEPLLFYYKDSSCRGINVVMKRDISIDKNFKNRIDVNKYFDFATPYGYGGWLIEGEKTDGLFKEYDEWVHDNHIVCEFVRFHPMIKNHSYCGDYYTVIKLGEVVHMDLSSPEIIWNNMSSKNRNMIRKAMKNDVKVYNGRFPEIYEQFREIYNQTMKHDNADDYYYFEKEFYDSLLTDLPHNAQVFWAEKDNRIIACSIMLYENGKMNYHLSGSIREFRSFAPTNLILYQAALWGCMNGFKTLYLGGGLGSGNDGLFKFKRSFSNVDLNHFYVGQKVFESETYQKLTELRGDDFVKNSFFPTYRG